MKPAQKAAAIAKVDALARELGLLTMTDTINALNDVYKNASTPVALVTAEEIASITRFLKMSYVITRQYQPGYREHYTGNSDVWASDPAKAWRFATSISEKRHLANNAELKKRNALHSLSKNNPKGN